MLIAHLAEAKYGAESQVRLTILITQLEEPEGGAESHVSVIISRLEESEGGPYS
jgi:hypothetical protein